MLKKPNEEFVRDPVADCITKKTITHLNNADPKFFI